MAEESFQERTESPSPKRRQEAAKKGEIPRSQEVTIAVLLVASPGLGAHESLPGLVQLEPFARGCTARGGGQFEDTRLKRNAGGGGSRGGAR